MPADGIPPGVNGSNGTIKIAGVSERDIDLLLLEEFLASEAFCAWFIEQALGGSPIRFTKLLSAQRAVTQTTGESDLEVVFSTQDQQSFYLLVENKIAASFQPNQAARYRCRGDNYLQQGKCNQYATVLVAPQRYVGDARDRKGFDAWVSYEAVQEWFQAQHGLGDRRRYKLALLAAAITKGTFGYQPEADAPVTVFWKQYWTLAHQIAAELEMVEPNGKPAAASFVYFRPGRLPKGVSIVHKLNKGCVDVQVADHGAKLADLHAQFDGRLLDGMEIARAAKSGVIRLHVPAADPAQEFAPQEADVREGLAAAKTLLRWYEEATVPL